MADWEERRRVSEGAYGKDPLRFTGEPSPFAVWVLGRLGKAPGVRDVVEIGSGPGRDARRFAEEGFRVRAVEMAPSAVARAVEMHRTMREPARSRLSIVEAEASAFLGALGPETQDVVYSHLAYHGFSEGELQELFGSIHRVLRPGGLHIYCARDTTDPLSTKGECVGTDTRLGGPHEVAYRYFSLEYCDWLRGTLFDRVELVRDTTQHTLYVIDRRRAAPPPPPAPPRPARGRLLSTPTSSGASAAESPADRRTGTGGARGT